MNRKRTTNKEVAKLAGVSHMTVSRVLNNFPHVSPAIRRKVLQICRRLNYRPNLAAVTLRGKKSCALGVVVPFLHHTYYAQLLNSIEEACRRVGYHVVVIQGRSSANLNNFLTREDFEFLLARQIDGLLIDLNLDNSLVLYLKREGLPLVFIDIPPAGNQFSFVGTADFEGGKEITEYLLRLGHRRIVFLAGPKDSCTSQNRLAGYRAALTEARIAFDEKLIHYTNYHLNGGYRAACKLLLGGPGKSFSAIACANDYIAIGAMAALSQKNVKVPQEVSVTGFGGTESSFYTTPPLTTMGQPVEKIGRKAVELIMAQIQHPGQHSETVLLPATLLKRSSTAPLKTR